MPSSAKTGFVALKNWCAFLLIACMGVFLTSSGTGYASTTITNPLLSLTANEIAVAYGGSKVYTVTRNGKTIGEHALSFQQTNNTLTVIVDSNITVRFLGIPVYKLSYKAQELWQDNKLVSSVATTVENGEANTVELSDLDNKKAVRYATNHWHPGVLTGALTFNTLTGLATSSSIITIGTEPIKLTNGKQLNAVHYQYEDDNILNVWYDQEGLWLKMAFDGEDGSRIEYLRAD